MRLIYKSMIYKKLDHQIKASHPHFFLPITSEAHYPLMFCKRLCQLTKKRRWVCIVIINPNPAINVTIDVPP